MHRKYKPIDLRKKPEALRRQGTMRPKTIERYIKSVEIFQNAARIYKRVHPMSKKISHPYRYDWKSTKHTVITHESPGKTPRLMQQKKGVLTNVAESKYLTPKKSGVYQPGHDHVDIITPGGHKSKMEVLEKPKLSGRKRIFDFMAESPIHEVTTRLSYKQLSAPVKGKKINNRLSHGGESADEKAARTMLGIYDELKTKELITHHEYTHAIAGHWGIVKEEVTGAKRDPAAATSTFIAPAAFNTEMILFERFADFLVFLNHHRYHVATTKPSIEYTMRYQQDPQTHVMSFAEIKIKDLHTRIEFTHHWDNPSAITEKPSAQVFIAWLEHLKNALDRTLTDELVAVPAVRCVRPLLFSSPEKDSNRSPGTRNKPQG
ncbi:MAG: hypothetical protein ACHQAX_01725 [Gammaproteobacteria bacterium]